MENKNKIYVAFKKIKAEEDLKNATLRQIYQKSNKKADKKQKALGKRTIAAVMMQVAVFILLASISYHFYFTESAYIDIDVNPSIELTLNRFNKVIGVYAYNEAGVRIIEDLKLKYKSSDVAVESLIAKMKQAGYLQNESLLSATLRTDWEEGTRLQELETVVTTLLGATPYSSSHEIYTVDLETKQYAHEENVTPAKYLAILELQELAPETTVEGCRNHSISEIREETYNHEQNKHKRNMNHGNQSEEEEQQKEEKEEKGHGGQGHQKRQHSRHE